MNFYDFPKLNFNFLMPVLCVFLEAGKLTTSKQQKANSECVCG